jgi:hypothetical protein
MAAARHAPCHACRRAAPRRTARSGAGPRSRPQSSPCRSAILVSFNAFSRVLAARVPPNPELYTELYSEVRLGACAAACRAAWPAYPGGGRMPGVGQPPPLLRAPGSSGDRGVWRCRPFHCTLLAPPLAAPPCADSGDALPVAARRLWGRDGNQHPEHPVLHKPGAAGARRSARQPACGGPRAGPQRVLPGGPHFPRRACADQPALAFTAHAPPQIHRSSTTATCC